MLTLIGVAYEDGWAFVDNGENDMFIIRPPYHRDSLIQTNRKVLEQAIGQYGFSSANESFDSWHELIDFLKEKYLKARKALALDNLANVRELLDYAPPYILNEYLDRVERELLPGREWLAALQLLTHLLNLETVWSDHRLRTRTAEAFEMCITEMSKVEQRNEELLNSEHDLEEQFPEIANLYGSQDIIDAVSGVKSRGSIWA